MQLNHWLSSVCLRLQSSRRRHGRRIEHRSLLISRRVENLEDRSLLTVQAAVVGTELFISSNGADNIAVQSTSTIPALVQVLQNGTPLQTLGSIPAASLTRIEIDGGDGDNTIDLRGITSSVFNPAIVLIVDGGNGNDTIFGSNNIASSLSGGDGADTITGGSLNDTLRGGNGNDLLSGGNGNDSLLGQDGLDSLVAGAGNDTVDGGASADTIDGGDGTDSLLGGSGTDSLLGGLGNDTLDGGSGNDTLDGQDGNDSLLGGSDHDSLLGSAGADNLNGEAGRDTLDGGTGADSLDGGDDADSLLGGDGNDFALGSLGNDTVVGQNGNDVVYGGGGHDQLFGDSQDTLQPGTGNDIVLGHAGNDTINGGGGTDTLQGDAGNDLIRSGDLDSDNTPQFQISDAVPVTEGDSDQVLATLTISLQRSFSSQLSVQYATVDFTATAGVDYQATSGTLTFAPGVTSRTITVPVFGDLRVEQNESFFVQLSAPSAGSTIADDLGLVTIIENQDNPTQLVFVDFDSATGPGEYAYSPAERAAILANLNADYAAFFTTFTDVLPTSGSFTRLILNAGGAGGLANEIDFRNLRDNNVAVLAINGLLGGPGLPALTSQNAIALTSKIAGHELGHTMGLRHHDSFGPIGSGISPNVPNFYAPPYPGPTAATQSNRHLMATPALGIETLADAVNDEWLGAREAVKLSVWAYRGQVLSEQSGAHGTIASAQSISLEELTVPNTELEGPLVGLFFDVDATVVTGAISQVGEIDIYSFDATAGQLLNVEVMSSSLAFTLPQPGFPAPPPRFINSVDTVLRVLDSTGNPIPYYGSTAVNDDGIEGDESILIDLIIPADGTYFIEIRPALAADTGNYELLAYTFAATAPPTPAVPASQAFPPASGDSILGGDGNDTVFGADGDDYIDGQDGADSLLGGGGQDTLVTGPGDDTTNGGSGDDTVSGEQGNNELGGGSGSNSIILEAFANGASSGVVGGGSDTVIVRGNAFDNQISIGQSGNRMTITTAQATFTLSDSVSTVRIETLAGNDTVNFGHIDKVRPLVLIVDLGDGNDVFNGQGRRAGRVPVQVIGGEGNDTLTGTAGNDIFEGGNGNDSLTGGAGNDSLDGGEGSDTLAGGLDNDRLRGRNGDDDLRGEEGDDLIEGGDGDDIGNGSFGHDTILGESGNDTIFGAVGNDLLQGGNGADLIRGHTGNDVIAGGDGNDTLRGDGGNDTINGGDGNDSLVGGDGNDLMTGSDGHDYVLGDNGDDTLLGEDGDDTMLGAAGNDIVLGGDGDDLLSGNGGARDTVAGNEGDDSLVGDANSEIRESFVLAAAISAALQII